MGIPFNVHPMRNHTRREDSAPGADRYGPDNEPYSVHLSGREEGFCQGQAAPEHSNALGFALDPADRLDCVAGFDGGFGEIAPRRRLQRAGEYVAAEPVQRRSDDLSGRSRRRPELDEHPVGRSSQHHRTNGGEPLELAPVELRRAAFKQFVRLEFVVGVRRESIGGYELLHNQLPHGPLQMSLAAGLYACASCPSTPEGSAPLFALLRQAPFV
jgi:hypothetical protein